MWSFRIFIVVIAANFFAGCGFKPLYGHKGSVDASSQLASIRIDTIKDRLGQDLHNHLLDLFNPHGRRARAQFYLKVILSSSNINVAVSKEALATRVNYQLTSSFILFDSQSGKRVYSGKDRVNTGYNILSSNFATKSAESAAQARAVRQAAFNIQTQIASFFKTNPPNPRIQKPRALNTGGSR